jgi:HJR/Mrr/RecB family endonuclease
MKLGTTAEQDYILISAAVAFIVLVLVAKYLSKPITKSLNITAYLPLMVIFLVWLVANSTFITMEFHSSNQSLIENILRDLFKSPELINFNKIIIAISAIFIAIHRFTVLNQLNDELKERVKNDNKEQSNRDNLQIESQNMSNFYDIRKHFLEILNELEDKKTSNAPYIPSKHYSSFFLKLFIKPQNSNYSLNPEFKDCFKNIVEVIDRIYFDIYACNIDETLGCDDAIQYINYQLLHIGIEVDHIKDDREGVLLNRVYNRFLILNDLEDAIFSLPINRRFTEEFSDFKTDIKIQISSIVNEFQLKRNSDKLEKQATVEETS